MGVCVGGRTGEYVIKRGCGDDTGVRVWSAAQSEEAWACSRLLPSVTSDHHKSPNSLIPVKQKIILTYRKSPSLRLLSNNDSYSSWMCGKEYEKLRKKAQNGRIYYIIYNYNILVFNICGNKTSGNEWKDWRRATWLRTTSWGSRFRKICCFNINWFNCSVRGVTRCNVVLKGRLQTSYTC